MKELKFRLWAGKKFYYEFYIFNGKPYCWENSESDIVPWFNKDQVLLYGEPVTQQFTGLLDKNNKEIYEGDIIKWFHPTESIGVCEYFINEVFNAPYPNQCYFGLRVKEVGICHFQEDDTYEVIGNIFENADLLK
jgi:uncharacterized phage protein (TIGR01671 family)